MTIKEKKAEKKRLYALGYYEAEWWDGAFVWRCASCKEQMMFVCCSCELCKGACEWCVGSKKRKGKTR